MRVGYNRLEKIHFAERVKDAKAVADFPPSPQFRVGLNEVTSHLMTDPKGNSEFNFPETLNVSRGKAEGNMRSRGKQNSLFPAGSVIKCFVIST